MNDSSSWWAKRLGRADAPQHPQSPGNGYVGPSGGSITAAGTQAQMWQERQQSGPPPVMVEDPNSPDGQRLNWRAWTGGKGNREETGTCPNCGGSNFFSRRQNAVVTQNGMAAPAPQCFDCSYNGMFTIFGGDG